MAHTISTKKENTAPSFLLSFRLAIGKSVNVRLARQTRVFKIWATSLLKKEKEKKNIIYRKLIKNGAAEPFGKRGCSTWPLEHSEFFFIFSSFWTERKNSGWDARENPAWFRWKNSKPREKEEEKLWGGQLRIRSAFLLKHCEMLLLCVSIRWRNACESLS